MEIKILETFTFDGKAHPYNILGYWGCAFTLCSHGQRVRPGERCHKIQIDEDVDLVHLPQHLAVEETVSHLFMSGLVFSVFVTGPAGRFTEYSCRDHGPKLIEEYWRMR